MEVPVRDLKDHLSDYLKRAEAGEELTITSHGRPIARLISPADDSGEPEEDAIARLRRQTWIRTGKGARPRGAKKPIPSKKGEKLLSRIVLEDRQ